MTLPPDKIGDKAQQYEARVVGYPKKGDNAVGWSDTVQGAVDMGEALSKAPSATGYSVVDRWDKGRIVFAAAHVSKVAS